MAKCVLYVDEARHKTGVVAQVPVFPKVVSESNDKSDSLTLEPAELITYHPVPLSIHPIPDRHVGITLLSIVIGRPTGTVGDVLVVTGPIRFHVAGEVLEG